MDVVKVWKEKKGRATIYKCSIYDYDFGSIGELYVYLWLMELKGNGFVSNVIVQPASIVIYPPIKREITKVLKTKTKQINEHIASDLSYTADFLVVWAEKAYKFGIVTDFNSHVKKTLLFSTNKTSYIECKPDDLSGKPVPDKNMTRLFKTKQKCIYHATGIWVNLVTHNALFKATFVPERYIYTDGMTKLRKLKYKPFTLKTWLIN